jgi:hypothetical protein
LEVAKALEGVKCDAVIDGELVAIGKDGVSHFQLLQNALRHEAKLKYCAFDLMFENAVDLRKQPRAKELQMRCHAAKAVTPERRFIVGIAMDALDVKGSSEDFICLYTGDWTAKDIQKAQQLRTDMGYPRSGRQRKYPNDFGEVREFIGISLLVSSPSPTIGLDTLSTKNGKPLPLWNRIRSHRLSRNRRQKD